MQQAISYVSTANRNLTNFDISQLFDFVKTTNNNLCITGILMYSGGNFFQVMEGEKEQIQNLFRKIQLDSRHHSIIKIFDREITNYSFSEYHSSFRVIGDKYDHRELQHFLREEKSNNPDNFKNISYLTNQFMKLS